MASDLQSDLRVTLLLAVLSCFSGAWLENRWTFCSMAQRVLAPRNGAGIERRADWASVPGTDETAGPGSRFRDLRGCSGFNEWREPMANHTPKVHCRFSFGSILRFHDFRVCDGHHGHGAPASTPVRGVGPAFWTIRCRLCRHRHHSEESVLERGSAN